MVDMLAREQTVTGRQGQYLSIPGKNSMSFVFILVLLMELASASSIFFGTALCKQGYPTLDTPNCCLRLPFTLYHLGYLSSDKCIKSSIEFVF